MFLGEWLVLESATSISAKKEISRWYVVFLLSDVPVKVRPVEVRSSLSDLGGTSGTEMVRKT
jgi:hypothetical protein